MAAEPRSHLPISTRHAFALAFDLAVRRDPIHSLLVPFLLHGPWILALATLPPVTGSGQPSLVLLVSAVAVIGEFVTHSVIGAMLRFRARSVFNTPPGTRPEPAAESYARGLRRVPWLLVTETLRNMSLAVAGFFFVFPAVFLGFKLAFATEAVVLNDRDTAAAFQRSFRYSIGRFERWFEMIAVSGLLAIGLMFVAALVSVPFPEPSINTWAIIVWFLFVLIMPVIQYAWTFFYLRLVEIDPSERPVEVGPMYAGGPAPVEPTSPVEPHVPALGSVSETPPQIS
jgi:hypothetical protein